MFDGFLPVKPGRRVHRLEALRALDMTVVIYESPHRILAALEAMVPACVAGVPARIHGEHGWDVLDPGGVRRKYRMIRESLDAFVREDTDLALKVCRDDEEIDQLNAQIFREVISFMIGDPLTINRGMKISSISKYLERMADHATNIAEMVIFMVKGKSIRHVKDLPPSV